MLCMNTTHRITQTLSESLKERCQAHLCAKQKWNKHRNLRIKDGRSALTDWKIRQVMLTGDNTDENKLHDIQLFPYK